MTSFSAIPVPVELDVPLHNVTEVLLDYNRRYQDWTFLEEVDAIYPVQRIAGTIYIQYQEPPPGAVEYTTIIGTHMNSDYPVFSSNDLDVVVTEAMAQTNHANYLDRVLYSQKLVYQIIQDPMVTERIFDRIPDLVGLVARYDALVERKTALEERITELENYGS